MNPTQLFISYDIKDEDFKNVLNNQLSGLVRQGIVELWDESSITGGEEKEKEIKSAIAKAQLAIFLVSSDMMASNFKHDIEIKEALLRHEADQLKILPVLIRPCDFQSSEFAPFAILPSADKAITQWGNKEKQEEAWLEVTLAIKKVIYELRGETLPIGEEVTGESNLEESQEKITLHSFHKFSCNRRQQIANYEENPQALEKQKAQFYFVLGEEEQAHFGFVNRLAYEKGGHLLDIDGNAQNTSKLIIDDIILENISDLENLKKRLLRELMSKLNIPVNSSSPLIQKDLGFICKESPMIKNMNRTDYVSILLSIYEDEWDEDETPILVRWFIEKFCKVALPENAPTFLFFFGIIYEDRDPEIMASVEKAVNESSYVTGLPELAMVNKKDVTRWFRKYKIIAPDKEIRDAYLQRHFADAEEFNMSSVQIELQKIIDEYNKPR